MNSSISNSAFRRPLKRQIQIKIDTGAYFALVVMLLPILQIGFTYYLSVASICFALAMLLMVLRGVLTPQNILLAAITGLIFALLPFIQSGFSGDGYLRYFRELFFAFILIAFFLFVRNSRNTAFIEPPYRILLIVVLFELVFTLIQLYFLPKVVYIGLPRDIFVNNAENLPDYLDLYYSYIRPFGTYGEPSYLAFIMLAVMMMVYGNIEHSKPARFVFAMAAIVGLISQSMSFIIFSALIFFPSVLRYMKATFGQAGDFIVATVALVSIGTIFSLSRSQDILSGTDASANYRFFLPIAALPQYISEHPLGAPVPGVIDFFVNRDSASSVTAIRSIDNAFLGLAYSYGMMALLFIFAIFVNIRSYTVFAFVFASMSFNGAVFSVDKVPVIILAVLAYMFSPRASLSVQGGVTSAKPRPSSSADTNPHKV